MEVIKIDEQPLIQTPLGLKARRVVDRPEVVVMNLILDSGEKVPAHKAPVNVLFHIMRGSGKVLIRKEEAQVTEGDIIVSPAGSLHGLEAGDTEGMNILVFKILNGA